MIWTEQENLERGLQNMIEYDGKTCISCQWSNYEPGSKFFTCGYHHENFHIRSFCAYWTDPADPKLLAYYEKKKKELQDKIKRNEPTTKKKKSQAD